MSALFFHPRPLQLLPHVLVVVMASMGIPESVPGLSHAGQGMDWWRSLDAEQFGSNHIPSGLKLVPCNAETPEGSVVACKPKALQHHNVKSILRCLNPRMKLRGGLDQGDLMMPSRSPFVEKVCIADPLYKRQRVKTAGDFGDIVGEGEEKQATGGDEAARNEELVSGSHDLDASGDNQNGSVKGEGIRGGESSVGAAMSVPSMDGDPMSGVTKDGCGMEFLIDRVKKLSTAAVKLRRQEKENAFVSDKQKMQLEEEKLRLDHDMDGCVSAFKVRMMELLNWRNNAHGTSTPPDHSRGGFACVLLDKEYKVAYRLEPMKNQVACKHKMLLTS